jgi:SNF2 family DNA or RNA helicase
MGMKSTSAKLSSPLKKPSPERWQPHLPQKRGLKFLVEHGAAALLFDPGLGKTSTTYGAFNFLHKRKVARRALVVAPLRVCQLVWPAEAEKWADFAHLKVGVLHGKDREKVLANALDYDVLVVNPEGLQWLITGSHTGTIIDRKRWKALELDTLVIDELTKFKHTKGVRFKVLKQVLGSFSRRWGLTGTPVPNGLLDLFGQMYVLDLGNALGSFITHYRMKYFVNPDGQGWKWVLQSGAADLIYDRVRNLALRANAADYLDLPQQVDLYHEIELPPKVAKLYKEIEDDLLAKVDGKVITVANAAAAGTKLRQMANGSVYVDDDMESRAFGKKRTVLNLHDEKLDAVEELVNELQGQPLLLAYEFNHDLDRLRARFKAVPWIGAGVSSKRAKEIENAWNAGDIPLLLGHPASMGHGLNFQGCDASHVGWFSMFWDFELYEQFIKRVLRQGNKAKRVFNHHFVARDTTDMDVKWAQHHKGKGQTSFLEAMAVRRGR